MNSKEQSRELTAAEKERAKHFEKMKQELLEEGYKSTDLTVGVVYANVMSMVLALPAALIFAVLFFVFNPELLYDISGLFEGLGLVMLAADMVIYFVLIILHELIHGITWSLFAKKHWKAISFGFIAKYLTPYCSCNEALGKAQYILGSIMPTLLLGIVPAVAAVVTGSVHILIVAGLMIVSGGGDLTIVMKLLGFRAKSKDTCYLDHPYQVGLVAFEK